MILLTSETNPAAPAPSLVEAEALHLPCLGFAFPAHCSMRLTEWAPELSSLKAATSRCAVFPYQMNFGELVLESCSGRLVDF